MSGIKNCNICKIKSEEQSLLQNERHEYFCKDCFRRAYSSAPQLHDFDLHDTKSNKMFPNSLLNKIEKIQNFDSHPTATLLSPKRPLYCPHNNCNKCVSPLDLCSHFCCEHEEIPVIYIKFEELNHLTFHPNQIGSDVIKCMVVFKIIDSNSTEDLTVVVLATRSAIGDLFLETDLETRNELGSSELVNGEMGEEEEEVSTEKLYSDDDAKLIIWALSNITTNYSYTIAAATINVKVKYYGPLLTIFDKDFVDENCLSLSHYHVNGMSEKGSKSIGLDIIIHNK